MRNGARGKLLRAKDIVDMIGIASSKVYETFHEACVKKDKKPFSYDSEIVERMIQNLSLSEMLKWCRKEFSGSDALARKVKNLVVRGRIKSTQLRGPNTARYLPLKSQKMVENIFRHFRDLRERGIDGLLGARDAAIDLGINPITMNYLLNNYGEEFSLTEEKKIPDFLRVESCGRYGREPRVPYVKWVGLVTDAPRFLTIPIVHHLNAYFHEIKKRDKKSWVRNLVNLIQADEKRRGKYIYFQHQNR